MVVFDLIDLFDKSVKFPFMRQSKAFFTTTLYFQYMQNLATTGLNKPKAYILCNLSQKININSIFQILHKNICRFHISSIIYKVFESACKNIKYISIMIPGVFLNNQINFLLINGASNRIGILLNKISVC